MIDRAYIKSTKNYLYCPLVLHLQSICINLAPCKKGGVLEVTGSICGDVATHKVNMRLQVVVKLHLARHNDFSLVQHLNQILYV